jgi:hypothetical protein
VSRSVGVAAEICPTAIAERTSVIEPVKKLARRKAKSTAKKVVTRARRKSTEGRVPPSEKESPAAGGHKVTLSQVEVSADELFLNAVRDRTLEKLDQGELDLKIADGLRAVELKNKICGGTDYQGVLKELLEEIRREELGKLYEE